MRRYERLSVSRVRENCTHGLKGGPAPFLKGLPTREEQDLPKSCNPFYCLSELPARHRPCSASFIT